MAELWGEYIAKDVSGGESILTNSDFMLSSYRPSTAASAGSASVAWTVLDHQQPSTECDYEDSITKGLLEHTVLLEKYRKELHLLLGTAVQVITEKKVDPLVELPPFPECLNCQSQQTQSQKRDFARGIGRIPDRISPIRCRNLLQKSVAQILLFNGFTDARESAIEALTSCSEQIYSSITQILRTNVDQEAVQGHSTGFQDPIHRTLAQIGLVDVPTLLDDFRRTTVERHEKLMETCRDLLQLYTEIKESGQIPAHYASLLQLPAASESDDRQTAVLALSDPDDRSEVSAFTLDNEDIVDEDDAEKLLELAGINGFDITITAEQDEELQQPETPAPAKASSQKKNKAKRRKHYY